ncbi:hypothetical protein BX616_004342 [Lobosporangium transversale]|nr:hypothetical protein BX616_004342 [Lobosporangium transversale]
MSIPCTRLILRIATGINYPALGLQRYPAVVLIPRQYSTDTGAVKHTKAKHVAIKRKHGHDAFQFHRTQKQVTTTNDRMKADRGSLSKSINNITTSQKKWPTSFNVISENERIEGLDKEAVQGLFVQRTNTYTLTTKAFSIKAGRMPFREPPPVNIPLFVQKAIDEHDKAMKRYYKELQGLKEKALNQGQDEPLNQMPGLPPLPTPHPFILQYQLRNLRKYPPTIHAPHPPFRVTYVTSKKTISKSSVHRNFARKKLAAAVETVFRDHARPGYEFMIFAKPDCITTPQAELVDLMIKAVRDPILYGEKSSRRKLPAAAHLQNNDQKGDINNSCRDKRRTPPLSADNIDQIQPQNTKSLGSVHSQRKFPNEHQIVTIRWKNNRPPLYRRWWKHAMPNPLGRTQQSDAYLDRLCRKESNLPGSTLEENSVLPINQKIKTK